MDYYALFSGLLGIFLGAPMLLTPRRKRRAAKHAQETRLAELKSGADERFLDEARSLKAYPPFKSILAWRAAGAFFLIGGIFLIWISIHR